mgnify:CR=1 FL=1
MDKVVRIFMMPQQFPCGPQSSCCGPIGQTEEEIEILKEAIQKDIGCSVEVLNVTNGNDMKKHLDVLRLVRSFGYMALPIITLNGEVVSIGNPKPEEAVLAIKEKMAKPKEM